MCLYEIKDLWINLGCLFGCLLINYFGEWIKILINKIKMKYNKCGYFLFNMLIFFVWFFLDYLWCLW